MQDRYSGIVWILSGVLLVIYGILFVLKKNLPGVEQLVDFASSIDGFYIFCAAFLMILIEGLYIIGNFFPGSTFVVIIAILSQSVGSATFFLTILAIFIGWCVAGVINIFIAKMYRSKILKQMHNPEYVVMGRPFLTWFPAFRASYEVAQIIEGGDTIKVLLSSFKVKFFVSLVMMGITLLLPKIIDVNNLNNEDSMIMLVGVVIISFTVGFVKISKARNTMTK